MSLVVDTKIVKNQAESLDLKDTSTDACRQILSDVELKVRNVIKESMKYMRHFNREKQTNDDINCALQDLGLDNKLNGLKLPFENKYQAECKKWGLENKELVIKDEFNNIEIEFKSKPKIQLGFDWLMIKGKVPSQPDSGNIVTKLTKNQSENKEKIDINKEITLRVLNTKKEGSNTNSSLLIKDVAPNILSKEAEKFLSSFFKIFEEQVNLIDSDQNQLGSTKFLNVLEVIQKNPSLQILCPFIISHINNNYKTVIYNGALKKNLYVMILDAMFRNPKVNQEYQNHLIIKILDSFLTCPNISQNNNRDELLLRENTAKLLAKILSRYIYFI